MFCECLNLELYVIFRGCPECNKVDKTKEVGRTVECICKYTYLQEYMFICSNCTQELTQSRVHLYNQAKGRCFICASFFGEKYTEGNTVKELGSHSLLQYNILICSECFSYIPTKLPDTVQELSQLILASRIYLRRGNQEKICKYCGKSFTSTYRNKEYCDSSCRAADWRRRKGI